MTDLLTARQVQDILKVDRITIYRMLQDGRLSGIKVGSQWRFTQAEVDRLLEGRTHHKGIAAESSPLFPTHCVQTIQNLLSGISQMCALVIDVHGDPVTEFTVPSGLSRLVMNTTEGLEAYRNAWKAFALDGKDQESAFVCPAGLAAVAAPIHDHEALVGWFLVGQVYLDEQTKQKALSNAAEIASNYGLDPEKVAGAIQEVVVVSAEKWSQMQNWAEQAALSIDSILRERTGYKQRLQQIADLTQMW